MATPRYRAAITSLQALVRRLGGANLNDNRRLLPATVPDTSPSMPGGSSFSATGGSILYGWLAITGVVLAMAIATDLHLQLSDHISPIWQTISEYVHANANAAVSSAAIPFMVMCFALAFGSLALLSGIGAYRRQGRVLALILLGLWCTGLLLVALFPVDAPGMPRTMSGELHNYFALMAFIALPSAAWVLTSPTTTRCPWSRPRRLIRVLSTASLTATATLVIIYLGQPTAASSPLLAVGVYERLLFAIDLALLLTMARPLLRRTQQSTPC